MADINKVSIIGRLTRDAEQSYTTSGHSLLRFSIAVNQRRKQGDSWIDEAHFFDATVWGRQGESIVGYMTKGRQVAIDGRLRLDRWETQDGQRRSKVTIDANYVQLLGGSRSDDSARYQGGQDSSPDGVWKGNQPSRPPAASAPPEPRPQPGPAPAAPATNFEDDIPF